MGFCRSRNKKRNQPQTSKKHNHEPLLFLWLVQKPFLFPQGLGPPGPAHIEGVSHHPPPTTERESNQCCCGRHASLCPHKPPPPPCTRNPHNTQVNWHTTHRLRPTARPKNAAASRRGPGEEEKGAGGFLFLCFLSRPLPFPHAPPRGRQCLVAAHVSHRCAPGRGRCGGRRLCVWAVQGGAPGPAPIQSGSAHPSPLLMFRALHHPHPPPQPTTHSPHPHHRPHTEEPCQASRP